tara:strand:- start:16 stop:570 length:555 start_codon:yes stop_codon:yes gene_type:complete
MSRDLTPTTIAALDDDVVYPFFAIELQFDSETLRMWTGQGTFNDGVNDWLGAGSLLSISDIEETAEMSVRGATITLSGVPSEVLSLALSEPYQGRVCNIYFGVTGEDVFNQLFSGYMDQMNIEDASDTSTIELKVENRLIDLERARVARFTSAYQKSAYPGDKGLEFLEDMQDKPMTWGRQSDS